MSETENIENKQNTENLNGNDSPFSEEFDKDLVVNKQEGEQKPSIMTDEELIEALTLTEDLRKDKSFSNLIKGDPEEYEKTTEEVLKKKFKDYLQIRNISGVESDIPHSSRIPAEKVRDSGVMMEILDDPAINDEQKHSSVYVHKNENGDIEIIEVVCSCGKKTFISLQTPEEGQDSEYPDVGVHDFNYEELKKNSE
ncbi:MAG: hypothetical protein A2475_16155 [Ignavibacteria bacterium RIFOXYC2_FULL_35_21]|nr:MAG: hypothetical protein A2X63_14195 [Ignavibacteria bacterium GWA2_35_8]OGV24908.1 MAG: hypothetical protein A2475_16155 [Ignavibacteria bacterium RIFOXYC2_FULL_35_21]